MTYRELYIAIGKMTTEQADNDVTVACPHEEDEWLSAELYLYDGEKGSVLDDNHPVIVHDSRLSISYLDKVVF